MLGNNLKEANAKTPKTTKISDIFIPCFLNKKIVNMKTTTSTNSRIILANHYYSSQFSRSSVFLIMS